MNEIELLAEIANNTRWCMRLLAMIFGLLTGCFLAYLTREGS